MGFPKHKLLDWHFSDFAGLFTIAPGSREYANGDARDDQLCFNDEQDALIQLVHLQSKIHERIYEKNPSFCSECQAKLPYQISLCPICETENMGS